MRAIRSERCVRAHELRLVRVTERSGSDTRKGMTAMSRTHETVRAVRADQVVEVMRAAQLPCSLGSITSRYNARTREQRWQYEVRAALLQLEVEHTVERAKREAVSGFGEFWQLVHVQYEACPDCGELHERCGQRGERFEVRTMGDDNVPGEWVEVLDHGTQQSVMYVDCRLVGIEVGLQLAQSFKRKLDDELRITNGAQS